MERAQLFERLKEETKVLEDPSVERAFSEVDRKRFVGPDYEDEAYEDYALPLPGGSSIPQPTTTAFMFELLGIAEGEKVLLVGTGSGWTSALAAEMAGREGSVDSVELDPALLSQARKNLEAAGRSSVMLHEATGEIGLPAKAPFDKIISFAEAPELPQGLLAQLVIGGVLVMPIAGMIYRIAKTGEFDFEDQRYEGFSFSPIRMPGQGSVDEATPSR